MEFLALGVGDGEMVGWSGDGDDASVMQPVVVGADQHQVADESGIYPT